MRDRGARCSERCTPVANSKAAGASDELSNAVIRVGLTVRRQGHEALVVMVVAVDDDVGAILEEQLPDLPHPLLTAVAIGRKERVVVSGGEVRAFDFVEQQRGALVAA